MMKTICFLNVKGGVGKTTSSITFAHILATQYNKKILLIDIDKQANTTKFFQRYSLDRPSVSNLLTDKGLDVRNIIQHTDYENIDIIPANMTLLQATKSVLIDSTRPQHNRLYSYVKPVAAEYDYCIIDCPTDFNISTYNALNFPDEDVLVPIKIDEYSFEGLTDVIEAVQDVSENFNPDLRLRGAFVTMYRTANLNRDGKEYLDKVLGKRLFKTHIRDTVKVSETATFKKPICEYDKRCTASVDYQDLVKEYLGM